MRLKALIRKILNRIFKTNGKNSKFLIKNKRGKIKECYVCGEQFERFFRYRLNEENIKVVKYFQMVGSDSENYGCYYCKCNDRDRHLFMYFDKLSLWDKFNNSKILHFAPELPLSKRIEQIMPLEYIKCDIFPKEDWIKVDITDIDFEDAYFDIVICNHILEHVPDYLQALREISRVLKKDGIAVLQTPYSELLYNNFEDLNINNEKLRLLFYGQEDHVRIFSKRQFFTELSEYFTLNVIKNCTLFSEEECFKYGVNKKEDLIMVINNKVKI